MNSRPDLAAKVSMVQKSICKATVESLMEGNRVLNEAKTISDTSLFVRPIPIDQITFASFGDASFASASQLRAQRVPKSWLKTNPPNSHRWLGIPNR